MKYALLIHTLDWKYDNPEFIIDDHISFVKLEDHPVDTLYNSLCEESGLDDGEPYFFKSALILTDSDDNKMFPTSDPQSISSTLMNLLTIIHHGTIGYCRIISSLDNFKTSRYTFELYDEHSMGIFDHSEADKSKLDQRNLQLLQRICTNLKAKATTKVKYPRINNALDYFYLAWNVHTLEQTAIGLSIVMETLFAPHSNVEISHQVSFNVAKFFGETKKARQGVYKMIKKYYSIRSKIVHGDNINADDYNSIPDLFKFVSSILLKILSDKNLIILFNDNKLRKQYLDNLLFD